MTQNLKFKIGVIGALLGFLLLADLSKYNWFSVRYYLQTKEYNEHVNCLIHRAYNSMASYRSKLPIYSIDSECGPEPPLRYILDPKYLAMTKQYREYLACYQDLWRTYNMSSDDPSVQMHRDTMISLRKANDETAEALGNPPIDHYRLACGPEPSIRYLWDPSQPSSSRLPSSPTRT